MSKNNINDYNGFSSDAIAEHLKKLGSLQKQSNKIAKQRNHINKKQLQQSLLDFEQAERQYLIEKSKLQPKFRLSATETLTCEPDFVNDPDQASESSFLKGKGIDNDYRVLRLRLDVKGITDYMHPSIVFSDPESVGFHGLAFSMSEHVYFVSLGHTADNANITTLIAYFVYRDQTTLPVVHKYRLMKESNSSLQRWNVTHVDTVYAKTGNALLGLETIQECEQLFISRG